MRRRKRDETTNGKLHDARGHHARCHQSPDRLGVFELLELGLCCLNFALDKDEEVSQLPPGVAHQIAGVLDDLSMVLMAMEEAEEDDE
jgi:hypothetical protein